MQTRFFAFAFVFLASLNGSNSLKIPSYFKQCATSDRNFNDCAKKHGQEAIATLIKGDRKYRIPELNPLVLPELIINQGENLKIKLKNATIIGFKDVAIEKSDFDFKNRKIVMSFSVPQLMINSMYEMSGKILILPISGKGPSYLTLDNLKFTYDFPFEVIKKGKEDYLKPIKGSVTYDFTGMKLKFENLFNGDKILGTETNNFLNENWRDVARELGPGVAEALAEVVHLILSNVSDLVPYDELFPEKL